MKEHAKKALKHDFEVAGKTIPTLAVAVLFLIGTGSAALLSSFGTVSGEADVEQAIVVDGSSDKTQLGFFGTSYGNSADVTAGTVTVDTFTVENNMNRSYSPTFTSYDATNTEDSSVSSSTQFSWAEDGIRTSFVEYYPEAGDNGGANLDGYSAPNCDVTVSDSGEQSTVAERVENELENLGSDQSVVCVSTALNNPLEIDEEGVTVAADSQGVEIDLQGSSGPGVAIEANDVTFKGFKVANVGSDGNDGPSGQGIAVNGVQEDRLSGIELTYLEVTGVYDRGLVVDHSDDVVVSNVHSHNNRGADWDNEGGSYVSDGVIFWDVTDSEMKHITAHDNGDNGVYVEGQNNRVVDVLSYDNGDQGIDLSHGHYGNNGGTTVVNVTSRNNAYEGIEVESTQSKLEITGAVLKNNARSLHFTSSSNEADVVISESRISGDIVNDASQKVVADNNFFAQGTWADVENSNLVGDVSASYEQVDSISAESTKTVAAVNEFALMLDGSQDYSLTTTIQ